MKTLVQPAGQGSPQPAAEHPGSPAQPAGSDPSPPTPAADAPPARPGDGKPGQGSPPAATEQSPAGGETPAQDPKESKPAELQFTLPDQDGFKGARVKAFAGAHLEASRKLFDELKLDGAAQPKLLERDLGVLQAYVTATQEDYTAEVERWYDAVAADKDLGGERLATTQANVSRFLQTYKDEEFTGLLFGRGFINHPALVRVLNRAGAALAEPKGLPQGGPAPVQKTESTAQVLYGDAATPK